MTTPNAKADDLYPEYHLQEIGYAKRIAECLESNYPGYLWGVNVDLHGGMATIQSMALSGEWGCYLPLKLILNDPRLDAVKRLGGEILERYRVSRAGLDMDQFENLKRDWRGNLLVDAT